MVKVFPFEGILYNKDLLKDLSKVFTPPYDVISPEEQDKFYDQHDFNYIRLILGKEFPDDSDYNNKYVRAAAFLDGWLRHQVLVRDDKPALYAYQQTFAVGQKKYSRLGFIGLLRLEEIGQGKVYPHEATHSRPKIDRLQLMQATSANLEPIFCVYNDEKNKVENILKTFMKRKPLVEVSDKDRVRHRLFRIDSKPAIAKIVKLMRDKPAFIADGHHRYESALRFKNELKQKNTKFSEEETYNHLMVYFTSLEDKGLVILPIHRVLRHLVYFEPARFIQDLEVFFEIKHYKASKALAQRVRKKLLRDLAKQTSETNHLFGMYLGTNNYYLLKLKDFASVQELMPDNKPVAWKNLDTNILHYAVFDRILGITEEIEDKVTYVKEPEAGICLVDEKDCQVAFFLNPTKINEVTAIASRFEKMPQKSTFFYPKLLSGIVLNKIVHGDKVKL